MNLTFNEFLSLFMHRPLSYPHSRSFLHFQLNFKFTAQRTRNSWPSLRRWQNRGESRIEAPIVRGGDVKRRLDVEELEEFEANVRVFVQHSTGPR